MAGVHDDYDEEELQLDYDDICNEVADLQKELREAKLEASQLQLRLKSAAVKGPTVSAQVQKTPAVAPMDPKHVEFGNFVHWLAQHACLDSATEFDVDLEVPFGSRTVQMQRVVQWPLTFKVGKSLRLSAPIEVMDDLKELLLSTREHGKIQPDVLQAWVTSWELQPGELDTLTHKERESTVVLVHKASNRGILVASWPTVGALEAFRALCSFDGEPFYVGQRVEVEYGGAWYSGTLQSLAVTGKATVACDVDAPGVTTVAPVYRVRRNEPPKKGKALSWSYQQAFYEEPEDDYTRQRSKSAADLQ